MLERIKDVPQYLPEKYYRECADEDGAITKYRLLTDYTSYEAGCQAQLADDKKKLKEIVNPFEGYVSVCENSRMAKSQGFERFRQQLIGGK